MLFNQLWSVEVGYFRVDFGAIDEFWGCKCRVLIAAR